ncbi:MAG: sigma 54-interacting transcriptional regulator [Desulfohalobiaceae bacterium]
MHSNISALKLKVLSQISSVIHKALDLEQCLQDVLSILSSTLSMERGTITLLDRDSGHLVIMASHGLSAAERKRGIYQTTEGVTGKIFRTGKAQHISNVSREPLFLDKTGARKRTKQNIAFTGVPIIHDSSPIGVLTVDRLFSDEVSVEEDIEFLNVVATLIAQFISLSETIQAREEVLKQENVNLKYRLSKEAQGLYIVGKDSSMQDVERQIAKVAPTHATVLLLGESGTGKTRIGKIIHELSERKQAPFIKVNCASIPENLLESELFGYEKGAFTGAASPRAGRFEDARGGSIFLDEIAELGPGLQAKLLRVLQEREFERLGSNQTVKADVRVLAATNQDLRDGISQGAFRRDLYYRLNVFPITVPPLRQRKEDIPELLNHFLHRMAREYGRSLTFTPEALDVIQAHDWPGNVRELENLVERLVILAEKERIGAGMVRQALGEDLKQGSRSLEPAPGTASGSQAAAAFDKECSLQELEKQQIQTALQKTKGVKRHAARLLGISERQIGYRIRKYGLE